MSIHKVRFGKDPIHLELHDSRLLGGQLTHNVTGLPNILIGRRSNLGPVANHGLEGVLNIA